MTRGQQYSSEVVARSNLELNVSLGYGELFFFGHSMTSHVVPCLRCFQEVASRAEAAGRGPERPLGSPPARNERSALQPPQGILRSVIRGDIRNCGVSHVGNAGVYTQARVVVRPCVGRCLLVRQTPAKLQLAHNTVACSCNVR